MLNAEKYKEERSRVGSSFGRVNGKLVTCKIEHCKNCQFSDKEGRSDGCSDRMAKWWYSSVDKDEGLVDRLLNFIKEVFR